MTPFQTAALTVAAVASLTACGEYEYGGRPVAYAVPQASISEEAAVDSPATDTGVPPTDLTVGYSGDVAIGEGGEAYADSDPSALTEFRSALDPHGSWVEDGTYGTVWVPSAAAVGANFTPYVTAGHWAYGDDYVWVSDYDWGWAPFHYGRWVYIDNRGWSWIAGRAYSGAWVSWRTGHEGWGYVGWAPMPPSWYWHHGGAYGLGVIPRASYSFCATGDLFAPAVGGRVVVGREGAVVGSHTRPFTPATPIVGGPARTPASPTVGGPLPGGRNQLGPAPGSLGLGPGQFSAPPSDDRGLMRATQLSHPATAIAAGARPPVSVIGTGSAGGSFSQGSSGALPSRASSRTIGGPDYNGRAAPSAMATPTSRPAPSGPTQVWRPSTTVSSNGAGSTSFAPAPSYNGARSTSPSHSFGDTPRTSPAPSHYAPSYSSSQMSTPTVRSSPPPSMARPSVSTIRPSAPSAPPHIAPSSGARSVGGSRGGRR